MSSVPRLVDPGTPNDGLPPNWAPIDPTPSPGPSAAPPAGPPGPGPFYAASIPQQMQLTPDIMPTRYPGGIGGYRVMPPGPSGVPGIVAAVKSVVGQTGTAGAAGAAGAPGPPGSGSDGFIHGDSIWNIDDGVFWLRDDFSACSPVGSPPGFTSQLYWGFTSAGFVSQAGPPPFLGGLTLYGTNTSSAVSLLVQGSQQVWNANGVQAPLWALFEYPSWKLVWEFSIARRYIFDNVTTPVAFNWAQVSCYVGLGSYPVSGPASSATTSPRTPYFLGLRYDTDPTSPGIGDTDFVFEAVANSTDSQSRSVLNTQGTVIHTGIVALEGNSYRLEMECTAVGQVLLTLSNGSTQFSSTLSMPQFNFSGALELLASNGIGVINPVTPHMPVGPGTRLNISGGSGAAAIFNGTQVSVGGPSNAWTNILLAGSTTFAFYTGMTLSCYPAMLPYLAFGNDSSASPVQNSKALAVDFFGFAWNPAVGGGTGTPNPAKARYW